MADGASLGITRVLKNLPWLEAVVYVTTKPIPLVELLCVQVTADVSTEGVDRNFSFLGCFQRIPYISVSSSSIHLKTK
jgi:hypothetical protein